LDSPQKAAAFTSASPLRPAAADDEEFFAKLWGQVEADVREAEIVLPKSSEPLAHEEEEEEEAPKGDPMELALLAMINLASVDDLKAVKGIGPKSAAVIVAYRDSTGQPFEKLDDLVTKAGVPRRTIAKILGAFG